MPDPPCDSPEGTVPAQDNPRDAMWDRIGRALDEALGCLGGNPVPGIDAERERIFRKRLGLEVERRLGRNVAQTLQAQDSAWRADELLVAYLGRDAASALVLRALREP